MKVGDKVMIYEDPGVYLGTFQFITGLVFHVFEEV